MKLLKKYSANAKLSRDGKEFQLSENGWITLRRSDSKIVRDLRSALEEKYKPIIDAGGSIPEDKANGILIRVAVEAIVVNLRGRDWLPDNDARIKEDDKLQEITWDENPEETDKARIAWLSSVLEDEDQEPLVVKIWSLAGNYENFRDSQVEEIRGN